MTTTVSFRTEEELVQWFNAEPSVGNVPAASLTGIVKGGSVRRFYRILGEEGQSLGVLMEYSSEKEENTFYAGISRFFSELKVPVPKLLYHNAEEGLAVLEDLGSQDLHALKDVPWPALKAKYIEILHAIAPLWKADASRVSSQKDLKLMKGFDEDLYTWERDYFLDQCVSRFAGEVKPEDRESLHQECKSVQDLLLGQSPCLIHRDFQSHNIMLTDHGPVFVDFQGTRTGTWFYDLASLIYDPYMDLKENRRDELMGYATEMMDWAGSDAEFDLIVYAAATQRLMQALGAYGYLGKELEKEEFLQYVPIAGRELYMLATELGLDRLAQISQSVIEEKKSKRVSRNRNRRRKKQPPKTEQ